VSSSSPSPAYPICAILLAISMSLRYTASRLTILA
jgi:hypothetical protein